MNIFICGTIRNAGQYIEKVIENIRKISLLFDKVHIIFAYDDSHDRTLHHLLEFKNKSEFDVDVLVNTNPLSSIRTQNISNARNTILNKLREYKARDKNNEWRHFIMMDMDDICAKDIHLDVLQKHLEDDTWDSLSFNREDYYDIWALMIGPFFYSCWHWTDPHYVAYIMRERVKYELREADQNSLVSCNSAFCGFAIYKIDKFIDCQYDYRIPYYLMKMEWLKENIDALPQANMIYITPENQNDPFNHDCEHRHFHLQAILKNHARIRISPLCLFT
jgi:hypothetical protein